VQRRNEEVTAVVARGEIIVAIVVVESLVVVHLAVATVTSSFLGNMPLSAT
jgi:hypothetical protein